MRHLTLSTALASIAVLAAGCGSNSPTTTNQGSSTNNPVKAAYAYADCMRAHGVTNFPDPKVSVHNGGSSIAIQAVGANTPAFKGAQKKCGKLLPGPQTPAQAAAQQRQQRQALLALAICLRAHGVNGFPDPNAQGKLSIETIQQAGIDIHTSSFERTAIACARSSTHGVITAAQVVAAINHHGG